MGDPGHIAVHLKHKIEPLRDLNDLEIRTLLDLYFRHKCDPLSLKQDVALRGVSPNYLLDIFKCVDLIVEEQRDCFIGMCEKLRINLATFKRDYAKILDNLFAKEHKWSRMLTAVAFTYTLGNFCRAKGSEDLYEILPELLHQYLNQQPFASEIQRQGGLVSFLLSLEVSLQNVFDLVFVSVGWIPRILPRIPRKVRSCVPDGREQYDEIFILINKFFISNGYWFELIVFMFGCGVIVMFFLMCVCVCLFIFKMFQDLIKSRRIHCFCTIVSIDLVLAL